MICFVDIEHDKVLEDPEKRQVHLARRADMQLRLEETSGQACLLQRYTCVSRERLLDWGVQAVVISGNGTDWFEYNDGILDEMQRIILAAEWPILGFCGGLQLIATAHGTEIGPMRRLRDGESDPHSGYQSGYFKEWGFMPVLVSASDPLFKGLGKAPVFFQAHYWEVKQVPDCFHPLASTPECPVQTIKHDEKLVYGTQFHPELYDGQHTDGRDLLVNFFQIAGIRE
jgi:GMP synthase-like glutamine amidotransferase